jgi:hypothetical protein
MSMPFALHSPRTAQKPTSGFAPLVGVPPIGQRLTACRLAGGTPYPLRSRGSEFNQLAPHTPGRLDAPRSGARRQRRGGRSPPTLKDMAQHAFQRPAPQKLNCKPVFHPMCSANEGTWLTEARNFRSAYRRRSPRR